MNASDCCNCVKDALACPATTNTLSDCAVCESCPGHCHACLEFYSFNNVHRTHTLLIHVSQHSSSCRLLHNPCLSTTMVNDALLCANKRHINFDYHISQKVLIYKKTLEGKLKPKPSGTFEILWVHSNRTLTIGLTSGITVCVNACCILPYW